MDQQLSHQKCIPCEEDTEPLKQEEIDKYKLQLKLPWQIDGNKKMFHQFKFKDFKEAMVFINKLADIANEEGHHPDLCMYYNKVDITLTTHKIGGLSTNDFIMAVKIEEMNL